MIHGKNIIGYQYSSKGNYTFKSFSAAENQELKEDFYSATDEELNSAVDKAANAFFAYKLQSGKEKGKFLRLIAQNIEKLGDVLISRASAETGLPQQRILGERGRTINQIIAFADLIEEGSWIEASIVKARPERQPLPKPDIRKMLVPLGPVAIFTASNFPLAFSTAGGDTIAALAAGNPVIVKGHPYHPGTNELVAGAIMKAAKDSGLPDGVFSSLNSHDHSIGQSLVLHPLIKAVAFTGSFKGGKALYDLAQKRKDPIPVFAEMGSVNPVVVLPEYLQNDVKDKAGQLVASICLGSGQFCTNPGLIFGLKNPDFDRFVFLLGEKIKEQNPAVMLNPNILKNYQDKVNNILVKKEINSFSNKENEVKESKANPVLAHVDYKYFKENPSLSEEIFGPFSLVVSCNDYGELDDLISGLEGQLTGSVFGEENDFMTYENIVNRLREKVGRLIFNNVPTGVEVCPSMHHGGPFPSTTDSRFTSVGIDSIKRFVRPLSFQNAPDYLLPQELKNDNPLGILRKVDGTFTNEIVLVHS
jgi:2,5-dioxopentanoate dehydrogenase